MFDGYPPEFNEAHVRTAIENADRVPFEVHPDGRPWRKAKAGAFTIAQVDRAQAWQLIRLALGFLELRLDPASYRVNRVIEVSTDGGIRPYDLARNDGN